MQEHATHMTNIPNPNSPKTRQNLRPQLYEVEVEYRTLKRRRIRALTRFGSSCRHRLDVVGHEQEHTTAEQGKRSLDPLPILPLPFGESAPATEKTGEPKQRRRRCCSLKERERRRAPKPPHEVQPHERRRGRAVPGGDLASRQAQARLAILRRPRDRRRKGRTPPTCDL